MMDRQWVLALKYSLFTSLGMGVEAQSGTCGYSILRGFDLKAIEARETGCSDFFGLCVPLRQTREGRNEQSDTRKNVHQISVHLTSCLSEIVRGTHSPTFHKGRSADGTARKLRRRIRRAGLTDAESQASESNK
jgi:hypothetical protein